MASLMESFDTLKKNFGEEAEAARIIEREAEYANQWIAENTAEEPDREPRKLGRVEEPATPRGERSIFDDIDAERESDGE
jgi:hypothetical protein